LSGARAPQVQVLLDGAALPGVMAADVFATSQLSADRFRVRFAVQALGAAAAGLRRPGARVELQGTVMAPAWVSLLVGEVDSVTLDAVHGTLEVEGRDLAARLIEAQAGENFANQTSSEIVEAVAARHGLAADVTVTSTPVGRYYQDQHDRMTLAQFARAATEWDLLTWLAVQEGFVLGLLGDRLQFGPRDMNPQPITVQNCLAVEGTQQVSLLRPIEVTVRSWGTRAGAQVEQKASAPGVGPVLSQIVTKPNLSADQALALAQSVLADLQLHARTARIAMPGELMLSARGVVAMSGMGAGWDGTYAVGTLDRHLDAKHGFTQTLELQSIPGGASGG